MAEPDADAFVSVAEAARFLGLPEGEVADLADADGRVPLERLRGRAGSAAVALELARATEKVGKLSGQLGEVRAQNVRLQNEIKNSVAERRRLTEEVLTLRSAAEERLMLMERIEQMSRLEEELEEMTFEVERLSARSFLGRLLNR